MSKSLLELFMQDEGIINAGKECFKVFRSFLAAGFNEDQALKLVANMIAAGAKKDEEI